MPRFIVAFAVVLSLTACQTPAERTAINDAKIEQRLDGIRGKTMAQFIAETGVTPTDAYNAAPGRVFVFEGRTCRILLQTERVGSRDSADNFRIVGASHFGGCDGLAA